MAIKTRSLQYEGVVLTSLTFSTSLTTGMLSTLCMRTVSRRSLYLYSNLTFSLYTVSASL